MPLLDGSSVQPAKPRLFAGGAFGSECVQDTPYTEIGFQPIRNKLKDLFI
jgi:hypothetical protein